jgi:predicted nuclease with RNAse H fold
MKALYKKFIGVDYGAKQAGTTAVCRAVDGFLCIEKSKPKADADRFLQHIIQHHAPQKIWIDAPLSLPLAYTGKGSDFFFREADRKLGAMSPLFLGGLTARAMNLSYKNPGIQFIETYPSYLVKHLALNESYKKDIQAFTERLNALLPLSVKNNPLDWHMIDSVLAWFSGYRFLNREASAYGNKEEGLIWI